MYVDRMQPCIPNKNWRYRQACHLFADTDDELHTFAESIGLKRAWFQIGGGRYTLHHYDLTAGKQKQAIRAGAVLLETNREIVARWKAIHKAEGRNRQRLKKCSPKSGHFFGQKIMLPIP